MTKGKLNLLKRAAFQQCIQNYTTEQDKNGKYNHTIHITTVKTQNKQYNNTN